jgi:hypothetical protein
MLIEKRGLIWCCKLLRKRRLEISKCLNNTTKLTHPASGSPLEEGIQKTPNPAISKWFKNSPLEGSGA